MINLGPIALFSNYKLPTSSTKHLKDIRHAHIVSLMYKLFASTRDGDDLSIGFDRDGNRRQQELTNNRNMKEKYRIRIFLKENFGFAEYHEKATFALSYKLSLAKNSDNAVLSKVNATNIGKVKLDSIEWYVPHYTPSIAQQAI